ncbi:MAG: thiolase domain-containing protein [Candidatus Hodarchaeota archaeon]
MRNVAVVGAGVFPFGRHHDLMYVEMGRPAVNDAIEDAGIDRKEIQSCYVGTTGGVGVGHEIVHECGFIGIPIARLENACNSGTNAFRQAWMEISSGLSDISLVIGIEKMKDNSMGTVSGGSGRFQLEMKAIIKNVSMSSFGLMGPPGYFALAANRHMNEYGTTKEDLARVVVKSRENAHNNPKAEYQNIMTVDEVLNDKMINPPLTRCQCTPKSDGAAAIILMGEKLAKKHTDTPVWIKASTMTSSFITDLLSNLSAMPNVKSSRMAFDMAKVEANDFYKNGFAEVHDCFSISELLHYEDFGWCKKGEGPKMLNDGITQIDGDFPVNPSGGLLSCGHPLGATGVRQIAEIFFQMRKDKEVAKRQVPDESLNIALTHTMGQPMLGFTSCVNIFSRDL